MSWKIYIVQTLNAYDIMNNYFIFDSLHNIKTMLSNTGNVPYLWRKEINLGLHWNIMQLLHYNYKSIIIRHLSLRHLKSNNSFCTKLLVAFLFTTKKFFDNLFRDALSPSKIFK